MAIQHALHDTESHVLQAGDNFALVALMTPLLPQSVLVQLFGAPVPGRKAFSLYAVYREESMTFDAIIRFDPGAEASLPKGELLRRFVCRPSFETAVLHPLVESVRRHFDPLRR